MTYHEFLAYLFDREPTRDLAITIAAAVQGRAAERVAETLN
jgi:hypothetical protein